MIPDSMPPEHIITAMAVLVAAILVYIWRRAFASDRPTARYVGRHHEDTVEIVPLDWMPAIGARRLAEFVDTQQMEAVE